MTVISHQIVQSKAELIFVRGGRIPSIYLATVKSLESRGSAYTCEHGHEDCASRDDGACSEEIRMLIDVFERVH